MTYIRKTYDEWPIMWSGEEVDSFLTRKEARLMVNEYNLAFKGGCWIGKKRRVKKEKVENGQSNLGSTD